jgi:hypothetical protein
MQGQLKDQIFIATRTGVVHSWKSPNPGLTRVFSVSADTIAACTFNVQMGVFICATSDGILRFFSSQKWNLLRTVPVNGIPEKVMTTGGWGFVIVYAVKSLMLFTLNAFLIKSVEIEFAVSEWSHWTDRHGFDYVCLSDPFGNIFQFEAFYPEKAVQIASLNARIISVGYSSVANAVVAVAASPVVFIIPLT